MSTPWRTAIAAAGTIFFAVVPAQLSALTTLPELQAQLNNCHRSGNDALSYHTDNARVLVLANQLGEIGAVLLHSKTRSSNLTASEEELLKLITHAERPDVRRSDDGHSVLILYPNICHRQATPHTQITGKDRLSCLYNAYRAVNSKNTPHYWHGSGVSLRNYNGKNLHFEITLDMSAPRVEYAELRMSKKAPAKLNIKQLCGTTLSIPKSLRLVRKLTSQLGGATPIHADEETDTYLTLSKDVYTMGSMARLEQANKNRRGVNHYQFPELVMPEQSATLSQAPQAVQQPPPPPAAPQQPAITDPTQARRIYIEQLQKM